MGSEAGSAASADQITFCLTTLFQASPMIPGRAFRAMPDVATQHRGSPWGIDRSARPISSDRILNGLEAFSVRSSLCRHEPHSGLGRAQRL